MVRLKNRYVLCEVVCVDDPYRKPVLTDKDAYRALRAALQRAHGDYGMGVLHSSLNVKYLNPETGIIIIRACRSGYKMVTSTLPFIRKVGTEDCIFKVLHIAGTIRSCQKFVARYHRQQLIQLLRVTTDQHERKAIQALLLKSSATSEAVVEREEEDIDVDSDVT